MSLFCMSQAVLSLLSTPFSTSVDALYFPFGRLTSRWPLLLR